MTAAICQCLNQSKWIFCLLVHLALAASAKQCLAVTHKSSTDENPDRIEQIQLKDIVTVWLQRRERLEGISMEWEGELTYGKGSLFWSPTKIDRLGDAATALPGVPKADVTFHIRGSLTWQPQDHRFRLDDNIPSWDAENGRHFQQHRIL